MSITISDFYEEIISHHRILLNAPVGSGKTQNILKNLSRHYKILLITSRKSIRDASANDVQNTLPKECQENLTIIHQWQVEGANYDLSRFEYVVVDEIHLLTSDSAFSEAAWHVENFIRSLPGHIHLLMMSACSSRVKEYIETEVCPGIFYLDLEGKVDGVKPQSARTITAKQAWSKLISADSEHKILYFVADTKRGYEMESKLRAKGKRVICITKKPENRIDKEYADQELRVLDCINNNCRFPEDIDIVISTSMLREGNSFHDDKIGCVISELKDWVSLKQIAGRVRHGVREFLVVKDIGNRCPYHMLRLIETVEEYVVNLNGMMDGITTTDTEMRKTFIELLRENAKKNYGYLIIFAEDRFHVSRGLVTEIELSCKDYDRYRKNLDAFLADTVKCQSQTVDIKEILVPYLNRRFYPAERTELIIALNDAGYEGRQLASILKKCGYTVKSAKNCSWYEITALEIDNGESGFCLDGCNPLYIQQTHHHHRGSILCPGELSCLSLSLYFHKPSGSVRLNTNSELNVLASDPQSSPVSSIIEPAV